MDTHLGVDWASGTWVVVEAKEDTTKIATEPSLLNVWHEYGGRANEVLVDIPVHLENEGDRDCDREAKEFLGSRSYTVFWTPNADVIDAGEYNEAAENNTRGLGCQSWGLIPRIREVNALLDEIDNANEKVYESHPEVCFKAFNDGHLPSKKSDEGFELRKECLVKEGGDSFQPVADFVNERQKNRKWHYRIQSGRVEDVLDAAILALTARETDGNYSTLPPGADPKSDPSIIFPGD